MTACRVLCRGCLVAAALMIVVTSAGNTEGTTTDVPTTTEQDDAETESVEDSTIPATAPKIEAIQEPENPDLQDKKAESRTLEVSSTKRDDAKIEAVTESVTNSAGETGTEAVEQSSDPITEQSALESETTTESHDLTTQEPETETEESTDVEIETVKEPRIEKLEFVVPETLEQAVDPIRSEENNDIIKTETFASEIPHHEAVETETVKASETSETTEKTEVVSTGETLDQSQDPRNEEQETIIKTQTPDDSTIPESQQHEILATETVEEPVVPRSDQDASNDLETGKQARIDNIEQVETRTEPAVQEPINPTTNQPETVVPAEGLDQSTNPNDVTENPDAMEQITVKENIEKLLQDDEHQESFTQENHQTNGDSDANPTTTEAVVDSTETFLKELEAMIVTENDEVPTTDKSQEAERDILTGTTHHSPEKTDDE
ncbi:unnamed protein product [Notodromas monacha]|uniref:Uncharacterized protein n=1 Tax=Notodromas monacha TaxID=399045 RepID=A0A7R9BU15_9CRUS|nr:unnamed protein product [Notodromas monacha]CAG0921726.1 unnamed protein product [Notodromas monacha]